MFEAIMQIGIYLTMILTPVLIPGLNHAVHVVRQRQTRTKVRAVRLPQVTAPRRLSVPAAA
jgi:hypothetical protein